MKVYSPPGGRLSSHCMGHIHRGFFGLCVEVAVTLRFSMSVVVNESFVG